MLLEVYNHEFVRIDLIRTYEFVQYTYHFCDKGNFSVKVPVEEKSLKNLKYGNIILFESEVAGIINHRTKEFDESSYLTISGTLLNGILANRVFLSQKKYAGSISEIVTGMVGDNFLNPSDVERKMIFLTFSENLPVSASQYTKQAEETDVLTGVRDVLSNENFGYSIIPVLEDVSETNACNISGLKIKIIKPSDRTTGNSEGNIPVVFDSSLNNIQTATYDENGENAKNVFYVFGMENKNTGVRTEIKYEPEAVTGLERKEIIVNASNVRNLDESGNLLPDNEYKKLLNQKALESSEVYKTLIYFDGTIPQKTIEKRFGTDFSLGDFVTFVDINLNIEVDIQITGFVKSLTRKGEIFDLLFGNEKLTLRKLLEKRGIA